jgi:hypothetical protein
VNDETAWLTCAVKTDAYEVFKGFLGGGKSHDDRAVFRKVLPDPITVGRLRRSSSNPNILSVIQRREGVGFHLGIAFFWPGMAPSCWMFAVVGFGSNKYQ